MSLSAKVTRILLFILTIVDPILLLFSYYVFAGLGDYPIANILLGYLIALGLIGIPALFIGRWNAKRVEDGSGYNLPFFLACVVFVGNILAATLVGIVSSKIKPMPEEAFALRFSGAIAINMDIVALFLFIYSKVL